MSSRGRAGLLLIPIFISISVLSYAQVWEEDFESAGETTSGNATGSHATPWTTTTPTGGAASFTRLDAGPYGGIFFINQTGTEGVWQSNSIDISALGEVALEITVGGLNANPTDYVRAYYRINSGPEILFGQATGSTGLTVFTAASAVVSGSTLHIVVRGFDASGGGGAMGFDNVIVSDIQVLYSRANTAWNLGSTWSIAGLGGASCGCTPDADSRVVIGNNNTVTFTANGTAAGVEIRSTGQLQWNTSDNLALAMARGGVLDVQSGGTLSRGTTSGSTITFGNYSYIVQNAGTVDIGALVYTGSGGSSFVNSGTFTLATATGLSITGGNGYTFSNSGTLNFQHLDINAADITVNNSGIINQTGNFTDVDAGSRFNNLSGGTWNFGGTTTTNVRLFANNNSNTFNYNGAGQNILTPQDAYSNLTLSGSGAKVQVAANLIVNGNWTRAGTATFTPGANRVTLSGTVPQTISSTGTESFANLTINNSSGTSPQITLNRPVTVSTNLTMTDGNVDLNGNTFTLSSNGGGALTHTQNPNAGWMYGGSFTRNYGTGAVAVGNVAGYYPLGGSADSRPFLVSKSNTPSSNGSITVTYTDASTASDVGFFDGAVPIARRHDSFWTLTKTGVTAGTFQISLGGTGFTIGAVNQTRLTRVGDVIGTALASSGSVTDIRVHRSALTSAQLLNNFYIASTNAASTPLPIELVYFRAAVEGDEVITTWKTAQEKNNHFFTVERTVDFESFDEVGRLLGSGDSHEMNVYSLIDRAPLTGRSYYRLKQTDFDGKSTSSDPVAIEFVGPASAFVRAYPNPSDGVRLTIQIKGIHDMQMIPAQLYNQQGQKVLDIIIGEQGPDVFEAEINLARLPPGLYFLRAGRTLQLTAKVIIR